MSSSYSPGTHNTLTHRTDVVLFFCDFEDLLESQEQIEEQKKRTTSSTIEVREERETKQGWDFVKAMQT
eukprot:m.251649 g.251649  ORF g.251649 m.251649 type:complete len:69 (+) comp15457_c0_seq5:4308-4514(+)